MRRPPVRTLLLLSALVGAAPRTARAVIVYGGTGNNFFSPAAPVPYTIGGYSLDQYTGSIEGFLGTPISPRYFVTANHITGNTTDQFAYSNGTSTSTVYNVQRVGVDDDLAIWEIEPSDTTSFGLYAPLYTSETEGGQSMVVLGNGTARGAAVTVNGTPQGWYWGAGSSVGSWGTNVVSGTPTAGVGGFTTPTGFGGDFLQYTFAPSPSNPDEAIISGGDSGGPVFVLDSATGGYELAGINSLVDTVDDASGNQIDAALYDDTGFYEKEMDGTVIPIPADETGPLSSYATRIASRIGYIDAITGIPEPTSAVLLFLTTATGLTRRRAGSSSGRGRHGERRARDGDRHAVQ